MKSKYIFQFIIYLLLGVMAMADPGKHTRLLHSDFKAYDNGTSLENNVVDNDELVVYACNRLKKKLPAIKRRFRAETSFRFNYSEKRKPDIAIFPLLAPEFYTGKTAHLPPFYYVFLFRLTPF